MSLPEVEIANILSAESGLVSLMASMRQSKLDYIPIFTATPDDTFIKSSSAPWIRVTPIPGDDELSADDVRMIEYPRVEVDYWVRDEDMESIETLQQLIYDALLVNGWSRYYVYRYADPDLAGCTMVVNKFEGYKTKGD